MHLVQVHAAQQHWELVVDANENQYDIHAYTQLNILFQLATLFSTSEYYFREQNDVCNDFFGLVYPLLEGSCWGLIFMIILNWEHLSISYLIFNYCIIHMYYS